MSYDISIEQKPDYLHVTVTGENSRENVIAYFADLRNECEERNCFRLLIEERLEGPRLEAMDVYTIASEGSIIALGMFESIAYVDVYGGELMEFAKTIAVKRGMPIAVFMSVEDAKQWLRYQKSGDEEPNVFCRSDEPSDPST